MSTFSFTSEFWPDGNAPMATSIRTCRGLPTRALMAAGLARPAAATASAAAYPLITRHFTAASALVILSSPASAPAAAPAPIATQTRWDDAKMDELASTLCIMHEAAPATDKDAPKASEQQAAAKKSRITMEHALTLATFMDMTPSFAESTETNVEQPAPAIEQPAPAIQQPAPAIEQAAPAIEQPAPAIDKDAPGDAEMPDAADESQIDEISTGGNFARFMAQVCLS